MYYSKSSKVKTTTLADDVKIFIAALLVGILGVSMLLPALISRVSAHTGPVLTCQAESTPLGQGIKYASWGCGSGSMAKINGQWSIFSSVDDRRHDHSSVKFKVRRNGSVETHASSSGAPVNAVRDYSTVQNVSWMRIYRGGNYRTVWIPLGGGPI